MPEGQQRSRQEMTDTVVRKPRSRVITGWRHVAPQPKGPRRKRPPPPPPRQKT